MSSPDAYVCVFPHGAGEDGMAPCAALEAWVWSMQGGAPRVTFGGIPPCGSKAWRIAIWRAIAAEALAVAEEEEGTRAIGSRDSCPAPMSQP